MSKPFKTIEAQVILMYSRGLSIGKTDKTKKYLLFNNYYNTINLYSKHFHLDSNSNKYLEASNFSEVSAIMDFDRSLKNLLYKHLIKFEAELKSLVAYFFCEKYPDKDNYYNKNNFYFPKKNGIPDFSKVDTLHYKLNKKTHYSMSAKGQNAIKHYMSSQGHVPLWVLVNVISFGDIILFYELMNTDLKKKVLEELLNRVNSQRYTNPFTISQGEFVKILSSFHDVRNIVAHNHALYKYENSRFHFIYNPSVHDHAFISSTDPKNNFYHFFLFLEVFIDPSEYRSLSIAINFLIYELSVVLKSVHINDIINSMGFPDDWHLEE